MSTHAQAHILDTPEDTPPRRSDALKRLEPFAGIWKLTGKNRGAAPNGTDMDVTGEDSYEWLEGEFFLINRWKRVAKDGSAHIGMGLIGYDAARNAYFAYCGDNLGFSRTYDVAISGRVMTMQGQWERGHIEVSADGRTMTTHWDRAPDGERWAPLCDLEATRVH